MNRLFFLLTILIFPVGADQPFVYQDPWHKHRLIIDSRKDVLCQSCAEAEGYYIVWIKNKEPFIICSDCVGHEDYITIAQILKLRE